MIWNIYSGFFLIKFQAWQQDRTHGKNMPEEKKNIYFKLSPVSKTIEYLQSEDVI